ncbi:SbtR family transcriptional regulator [Kineosporia corallincola]|uniref:SbtR family transcriptional regulator n=1 Tax=Kineosporia corallincola TaxID=2835133 RepID=UPI0035584967
MFSVAELLLHRAQEAHEVRTDTDLAEILKLAGGIAKIPASEPAEIGHLLEIALDGLRHRSGKLKA